MAGLIQLGHPSALHRPAGGQLQLLKRAEEDQVVRVVIGTASVGWILWRSPPLWTEEAGKEKLGMSIPTFLQGDILGNLFTAVRIRRDDKDGVLHTITPDVKMYSSILQYDHCMHTYTLSMYQVHTCI